MKRCIGDVLGRFDLAGVTISEFYEAHPAQDDAQAIRTVLDLLEAIRHLARFAPALPG